MNKNNITNKELDWDEWNHDLDLEKKWKESRSKFSDSELLRIFPEAIETLSETIDELTERKEFLVNKIVKKLAIISGQSSPEDTWFWREWLKVIHGPELITIEKQIERLERLKSMSQGRVLKGRLTETDIERAKSVPIENLVSSQFKRVGNKSVALCPLHNEKTPSCYIYEGNTFYCHGCHKGGDVINFVMLLHGYSFPEAVKYINGI